MAAPPDIIAALEGVAPPSPVQQWRRRKILTLALYRFGGRVGIADRQTRLQIIEQKFSMHHDPAMALTISGGKSTPYNAKADAVIDGWTAEEREAIRQIFTTIQ